MTFDMVAEPHAVLFRADGEIPGDRGAGIIDSCRRGACDAVGLASNPGGGCCRTACYAASFARDEAPCKEWHVRVGQLKLRDNKN